MKNFLRIFALVALLCMPMVSATDACAQKQATVSFFQRSVGKYPHSIGLLTKSPAAARLKNTVGPNLYARMKNCDMFAPIEYNSWMYHSVTWKKYEDYMFVWAYDSNKDEFYVLYKDEAGNKRFFAEKTSVSSAFVELANDKIF